MALIIDSDSSAAPPPADLVKDSDTEHFRIDVIDASHEVPVVVDFWAPWCGPCKTLGPMLERQVRQFAGAVRMVKVNIDDNQALAAQLQIQSIPAVFAFKDGRPVDGFMGALPESQIKSFLERLTDGAGNPVDAALDAAREAFEAGQIEQAGAIYQQVMAQDPANVPALAGLLRCQVALGQLDEVAQALDGLPAELTNKSEIRAVRTALDLARETAGAGADTAALEARLAADPADHQARLDLAAALYGANRAEAAMEQLLESIRRERDWNDGAARAQLLKLFEALGPTDPRVVAARRRLSSLLFS
ncbi:thioredoxin [Roseospirillum parvum]|uniref:Thioredoxin n=1 Tax=Roseospirillum parvum TaxID=83401 RepID=A0A1G8FLL7_9PROT|nr:thioredoxin [Roseospirillum parvum]SDH83073.1 putative thioredoxin [Roseospirillum parvum]